MMVCQQKVLLQSPAPLQTLLPFMHLQSIIGLMEPGLMIFDVHLNLAFFPRPCTVSSDVSLCTGSPIFISFLCNCG